MCFVECGHSKYQLRCTVIAIISLIVHTCLLCLSITVLIVVIEKNASIRFHNDLHIGNHIKMYFEDINQSTFITCSGVSIVLNVLGVLASVMLWIGSKYNKPGCVVVYLCYILQLTILLLIGGILLLIRLQWSFAAVLLCLFGITSGLIMTVNRSHEAMLQDASRTQQDSISDITRLIEADSLDDMPPEYGEMTMN